MRYRRSSRRRSFGRRGYRSSRRRVARKARRVFVIGQRM